MPESLKQLIQDCWHKDPKHRPNMSEVRAAAEGLDTS